MKKSDTPYLAATGKGKGKGKGFKINSELDTQTTTKLGPELTDSQKELINDKRVGVITLDDVGRGAQHVGPHLIHNGNVSCCSECAQPVNIPTGTCGTCSNCGAQFGGCG